MGRWEAAKKQAKKQSTKKLTDGSQLRNKAERVDILWQLKKQSRKKWLAGRRQLRNKAERSGEMGDS